MFMILRGGPGRTIYGSATGIQSSKDKRNYSAVRCQSSSSSAPATSQMKTMPRAVLNMQISVQKFDTDESWREGVKVPFGQGNICIFKWLKCGTWHPAPPPAPAPSACAVCPVSGLLSRFSWLIKVRLNFERTSDKRLSGQRGRGASKGVRVQTWL